MKPLLLIITGIISITDRGIYYEVIERTCIPCENRNQGVFHSDSKYNIGDSVMFYVERVRF